MNQKVETLSPGKRLDDALASYDRAIALKPDCAEAYFNRGNALLGLKRLDDALASYDRAIALKPDYAEAYSNRGNTLNELKRLEDALASHDRAISLKPDYANAYSNRGIVLQGLKRLEDALASYDRAIALKPDYANAYSNRGNALQELKRLEDALASYDRAIALKPDAANAYSNRGVVLVGLKQLDDALASYDRAIALMPDHADANWSKSMTLLLNAEFSSGWSLYEWRWEQNDFKKDKPIFTEPLWLGEESLTGKSIFIHAEQGLGDSIQFCRYVSLLNELGASVLMEVPKPLVGLLSELNSPVKLIEKGETLPAFDCHCPMLSLPLAFKTELSTIPSPKPYLAANAKKKALWEERLGERRAIRIGLVWSGSTGHKNDHNRSLTLAELVKHLPANFEYVSLQKEIRDVDKETLKSSPIKYLGDELKDFSDTAALCDLMDVVISVDTSVAHLAGAIGKKTWVMLPYVPDWRWLLDRDDSPWYESVKLYRQDEKRSWGSIVKRIASDLQQIRL